MPLFLDGARHRVLRSRGRLVMIDVGYPRDDMLPLFERFGFEVHEQEVGGFGSVHLYLATKR